MDLAEVELEFDEISFDVQEMVGLAPNWGEMISVESLIAQLLEGQCESMYVVYDELSTYLNYTAPFSCTPGLMHDLRRPELRDVTINQLTRAALDPTLCENDFVAKVLIRYGICELLPNSIDTDHQRFREDLEPELRKICAWIESKIFTTPSRMFSRNQLDEVNIAGELLSNPAGNPRSWKQRRIWLIVKLLQMVLVGSGKALERAKRFELIFRTLPDPFISRTEIAEFLYICFNEGTDVTISLGELEKLFAAFAGLLAEYDQLFSSHWKASSNGPRSLKHLCRVRMRNSFKMSSRLPTSVNQLRLPQYLKDYVLCSYE